MTRYSESTHEEPYETMASIDNLFADYIKPRNDDNAHHKIEIEIQNYLNTTMSYSYEFDCLQWWNFHKNHFPVLYETSCGVLSTRATNTAPGRVFQMRKIQSQKNVVQS